MYRIAEFCAGIGGIRLGFEQTGKFRTVFANDIDKNCQLTYSANFSQGKLTLQDTATIDTSTLPDFDIMLAGFPCQSFSISGNRKGFDDSRGQVFFQLTRILRDKRPRCVFLENVKNLCSHDKGSTFNIIKDELTGLGYSLHYKVLNTCEYGNLPQNRERIYIIGFLDEREFNRFSFPDPVDLTTKIEDILESKVPEKYFYTNKTKIYEQLVKDVIKTDVVYQWRRVYTRENKSGLCPTLTANIGTGGHNVPIILDNQRIRKFTPRECFRLQGFPDTYKIDGNKVSTSQIYKQIGNSVSIPVVRRIAEKIIEAFERTEPINEE